MIGGNDLVITIKPTPEVRDGILTYFKERWPQMSLEKSGNNDWFVHRDEAARKSWDDFGGTDENQDTMIYVIFDEDEITLVVSADENSQTAQMVVELRGILEGRRE